MAGQLWLAPYTKVEESFNMQAIHDMVYFGRDLAQYDHIEFPGVVPRTFLGALTVASALKAAVAAGVGKVGVQMLARGAIGLANWLAVCYFRRAVQSRFGRAVSFWLAVLLYTQFHLTFYATRSLPNMLALPLATYAQANLITGKLPRAISVLTFAAVVFRAELAMLVAPLCLQALLAGRMSFRDVVVTGATAGMLGLAASVFVDSFFWRELTVPEITSVYFNAVLGKAAEWGVEPAHRYFSLHLPKLLLNPLALPLVAAGCVDARVRTLLGPHMAFIALYSLQGHKEWRFVVYSVPVFTLAAARGATAISLRKGAIARVAGLVVLASAAATLALSLLMGLVSAENYPGGTALAVLHQAAPEGAAIVYMDVGVCMTGVTRFQQVRDDWIYDKSEDDGVDDAVARADYAVVADREAFLARVAEAPGDPQFELRTTVRGYAGLNPHAVVAGGLTNLDAWADVLVLADKVWIYQRV
ncbi:Alg9-like mannosyltransferase family-domain-containing protein [Dipodascopsis tothii]|uniref:Alg9-like mannosyltransferase family-domain-containing protein n=1 Tax=Dipodascopsis tothii TaxID=44089 RepID=UPI0034CFBC09